MKLPEIIQTLGMTHDESADLLEIFLTNNEDGYTGEHWITLTSGRRFAVKFDDKGLAIAINNLPIEGFNTDS
jgi:hypothetical protein